MYSEYQHLIDLSDYPVSWWTKVVELEKRSIPTLRITLMYVTER